MSDTGIKNERTEFSTLPQRPAPPEEGAEGLADEPHLDCRLRGPLRRCAKCGSGMVLTRVENMYLTGKRLHFQCSGCGKEILVRSPWRLLLAVPGCLVFALFTALFTESPEWRLGIFDTTLAYYPLVLLSEIVTRARYPGVSPGQANCRMRMEKSRVKEHCGQITELRFGIASAIAEPPPSPAVRGKGKAGPVEDLPEPQHKPKGRKARKPGG